MNKKAKQKLAYAIAVDFFPREIEAVRIQLDDLGIEYTDQDVEDIGDLVTDIFDKLEEKSEGWQELL